MTQRQPSWKEKWSWNSKMEHQLSSSRVHKNSMESLLTKKSKLGSPASRWKMGIIRRITSDPEIGKKCTSRQSWKPPKSTKLKSSKTGWQMVWQSIQFAGQMPDGTPLLIESGSYVKTRYSNIGKYRKQLSKNKIVGKRKTSGIKTSET